jgi:hypothetical protein
MPCRADALCLGVLASLLVRSTRGWNFLSRKRNVLYGIAAVLFAGIAFMTYKGYVMNIAPPVNTVGYTWLALFYTSCLLIAVSGSRRGVIQRLLGQRWLMGAGYDCLLHLFASRPPGSGRPAFSGIALLRTGGMDPGRPVGGSCDDRHGFDFLEIL